MENGLLPSKHSAGRLTTAARAELLLAVTLGNEPVKPPMPAAVFQPPK
jgi:hypothetical protein